MSDFALPPKAEPKEPVSVRMPTALKAKINRVMELWRTLAKAQGADASTIEAIDFPYTLLRLLAGRTDEELQQLGGFAESPEVKKKQTEVVASVAKKHAK